MKNEYTPDELKRLHQELYDILGEIIRVCNHLGINYFIQGGTAIGAFFEQTILPWDDDIDLGMTRADFKRFVREAPAAVGDEYFVQWLETDPHTPYYYAKVMKRNTLFAEADFIHLQKQHGIFIDVFPFDRVPNNQRLQRWQRTAANFLNCCFMGKDIWMWKHCGTPQVAHPTNRGFWPCLFTRIVDALFTKRFIYRMLSWVQGLWNGSHTATHYNMVLMPRDHIAVSSIENMQRIPFGPFTVNAPSDLETYLRHHYPRLRRHIPKEEQQNHRPQYLSFDTRTDDGDMPQNT